MYCDCFEFWRITATSLDDELFAEDKNIKHNSMPAVCVWTRMTIMMRVRYLQYAFENVCDYSIHDSLRANDTCICMCVCMVGDGDCIGTLWLNCFVLTTNSKCAHRAIADPQTQEKSPIDIQR